MYATCAAAAGAAADGFSRLIALPNRPLIGLAVSDSAAGPADTNAAAAPNDAAGTTLLAMTGDTFGGDKAACLTNTGAGEAHDDDCTGLPP